MSLLDMFHYLSRRENGETAEEIYGIPELEAQAKQTLQEEQAELQDALTNRTTQVYKKVNDDLDAIAQKPFLESQKTRLALLEQFSSDVEEGLKTADKQRTELEASTAATKKRTQQASASLQQAAKVLRQPKSKIPEGIGLLAKGAATRVSGQ